MPWGTYGNAFVYSGAWTINQFLALPYGAVAHRGLPSFHTRSEFSFDAYDNAFSGGLAAGELSSHFSSDDVMLAHHDFDTTDQYTSTLTLATSSSAALQALTREYGVTSEPMRTTQEVLERYPDRVWLVENKAYPTSTTARWNAFFALLTAQPNAVNRIVFKAFYDSAGALAQAKSLGFTTWAYCYGSAGAQDLIDNHWANGDIDWVGFSSGPTNQATDQTYFDWAETNSVPVLAHIVRGSSDWSAMKAQGAAMAMVNDAASLPLV